MLEAVLVEIGVVLLTAFCFIALKLYVLGCERI
jgi:hypothetical protein